MNSQSDLSMSSTSDSTLLTMPNQFKEWHRLIELSEQEWSLTTLFAQDSERAKKFHVLNLSIYFDYTKQCINEEVMAQLFKLAKTCQLKSKLKALFKGDKVNSSEQRAALHTALRMPKEASLIVDNQDIVADVHNSLNKAESLVERIRTGLWRGHSGKAITDVINIGVGGSDLGPVMTNTALDEWADSAIQVHFVSNMDGTQLSSLLGHLDPETSLFIVSSKSFSTVDTLSNAQTARLWLLESGASQTSVLRRHFIGISASPEKVSTWGIPIEHQLRLWDWVGGRFSMWSAIGLAVAVRVGMPKFYEMLAGAHEMDEHFRTAEFDKNLPVILGMLGVWNSTFLKINAHTVLPYDGRLRYLPSYLTQLEMESNGKSVTHDGEPIFYPTCPILWGEVGSNAQHAFYQLLHQGTQKVSCDFIACVKSQESDETSGLKYQHALSLANCLAQSRVLAFGNHAVTGHEDAVASPIDKFKHYRGNQPSTTILLDELTPKSFGALIALYEHKVYVMASIWDINPFDQWGVEMGKKVANDVFKHLHINVENNNPEAVHADNENEDNKDNREADSFDGSTQALIRHINRKQE